MRPHSLRLALISGMAFCALASVASAQDWSGPYLGGSIGYGQLSEKDDERLLFDTNLDGNYSENVNTIASANAFSPGFCGSRPNANNAAAGCQGDDGGLDLGLRAGYDWQFGNFVVGAVGEVNYLDLRDSVTGFSSTPAAYTFTREVNTLTALRARAGYVVNDYLAYVTAGGAWGEMDRRFFTTNGANSFTPRGGDDAKGYQAGLGLEKRLQNNWAIGAEYLYTELEDEGYVIRTGPGTAPPTNPFLIVNPSGTDMKRSLDSYNFHKVSFTLSYRFAGM